jgi:hypothetical protein
MGSSVVYEYNITFSVDGIYVFHSSFVMGEETYTYDETGTFVVDGSVLTMTPEGAEAVTGNITGTSSVEISIKASSMAARALHTLEIPVPVEE